MSSAQTATKAFLAVAVMVGLLGLSGCYAAFDIPVTEASHLDSSAPVHTVVTTAGHTRTLDSKFTVTAIPREPRWPGRWPLTFQAPMDSKIEDNLLIVQGPSAPEPVMLRVDLIRTLQVRQISGGGTAGLVIGIVAGAATLIALSAWSFSALIADLSY